jgi:ABC-type branched-subunit amino acid transport system ATPase component
VGTTVAADALVLSEIDAFYGDSHVLHGVSLCLGEGRLLGLLGRKVFDVAADIVVLNSGRVVVAGSAAELKQGGIDLRQHLGIY